MIGLVTQFTLTAQTDTAAATETEEAPLYRLTNESWWLTAGHHHTYDSYLSSQLYKGTQLGIGFDQQRYYSAKWPKLSKYDGADFHFAIDENPAQNYQMTTLYVRGFYGAHYHLNFGKHFKVMPGAYTNFDLGIKYLPHNSNNPANVIANSNLWLSVIGSYQFNIGREPIRITDHFSTACIGMMFSPKYTELYYDMAYIDDYDGNIVGTNFGNRQQFRNDFSVDIPLKRIATFRLGMVAERLKYKVNHLEGRNLELSFKLGIVHQFYTFKGRKEIPANFISPLQ